MNSQFLTGYPFVDDSRELTLTGACFHRIPLRYSLVYHLSESLREMDCAIEPPANGPRLEERISRAPTILSILSIARAQARRVSELEGNDFHGISLRPEAAQHGVTKRVRYFLCGEWDRCSGDES